MGFAVFLTVILITVASINELAAHLTACLYQQFKGPASCISYSTWFKWINWLCGYVLRLNLPVLAGSFGS
jgi:hypothetical protein